MQTCTSWLFCIVEEGVVWSRGSLPDFGDGDEIEGSD
jgi:hypothetical protein